ncbi:MAG: 16S rRNA (guanine(527)-N(7))-methyltransferase RsmG [Nocardioidaceae bacterium]
MTPAVSRETPPPPDVARSLFGPALDRANAYAELLASAGVERGLIGPREVPRLWERHLLNCAVVAPAVEQDASVVDIGSGAGLPGLVWALCRPDLQLTLVESMLRRVRFLQEAVTDIGVENVTVVRARAEELHDGRRCDAVTARAVAPLDRLAAWCLPLLRPGGTLFALKGESAAQELEDGFATLRGLGATTARVELYGEDVLDVPTRVVVVSTGPARHPR